LNIKIPKQKSIFIFTSGQFVKTVKRGEKRSKSAKFRCLFKLKRECSAYDVN
jgi:hypothetical protein